MTFDESSSDAAWMERLREAVRPATAGRIGPYELVAEANRGGQGVVFRARQPGTNRHVALKRILGGRLATREARARFEREVEALCGLDHPNIVTVYGVESIDGQPVLAMEWIDGQPVDAWARGDARAGRPLRERLAVFLQVCDAVQHAHQRGVIHRDLKPSNILVSATGVSRVVDFGLARAVDSDSSDAARLTGTAELLGTPAYASPEQVSLDRAGLDTRTDVYSLGAVLYQLLCGVPPHDASRGLPALLEAIRKDDPPAPSSVAPGVDRDLSAITLKALARDPALRYQSVDALAADLRRYLAGEPVTAQPPSLAYQLRKLIGRHRTSFALVLVVLAALLAFAITTASLALRLDQQRNAAVAAQTREADARAAAEEVVDFLRRMLAAADPRKRQGEALTVSQVVDEALQRSEGMFEQRPAVDALVRLTLGETLNALGRHAEAQVQLDRSLSILRELYGGSRKETGQALRSLGHVQLAQGHAAEAAALYSEAAEVYRRLPSEQLALAATLHSLAVAHLEQRDLALAESLLVEAQQLRGAKPGPEAAESINGKQLLASLKFHQGQFDEAERLALAALSEARAALGDRHELTIAVLGNVAVVMKRGGRPAEARPYSEECLATARLVFGDDHPHTLQSTANHASLLQALGEDARAEALYTQLLSHYEQRDQLELPTALAAANNLGSLLLSQHRYHEAETLLRETLDRTRKVMGPRHPDCAVAMAQLATAVYELRPDDGRAEARQLVADALAIMEGALPPDHPFVLKARSHLARLDGE
ncbi:MAG: tetratricopeptide repeat protein [Phycisphaerae bacterium]|jgi:tRNA A-37 threonylcarbamoyl transferase component Bud32/tetratricopeptide (TPR) repeat protein|nr:tetratricopeptide repeat protein [Phycisphaerae bacterium]MCZ2398266.1 tetratricopeptide repeat protein [Phycisphaerae bacterium]NUQ48826.1 tetratricopeptide repeat protein [Phycisphaerae bacterium]